MSNFRFFAFTSLVSLSLTGGFYSCTKDTTVPSNTADLPLTLNIPKGFPYPSIPSDNIPTVNRVNLGKKLFYDPVLSVDSSIACASCHHEYTYFSDTIALSLGVYGQHGKRNAPGLYNVAYAPYLFWDGGVNTLEEQIPGPIQNPIEMDNNINLVVARLAKHPEYVQMFKAAYDGEGPDVSTLTRAIASYERTLYSGNSRYDEYLQDGDTSALNASEKRGMNIFFGEKGECFHCHGEYNFTSNAFEDNGLYAVYPDSGRMRITLNPADYGKFKVPSLRNCDKTAPYMFDGSLKTLDDVVDHYNSGGQPSPNKSFFIKPLGLTDQDKTDLVNFLKALTDTTVVH